MRHPYFDHPAPLNLGHRGASGEAPENTLAAFALALGQGADVIETDVRATRDGFPVLLHDDDLARTTDRRGSVTRLAYTELLAADAGHAFSKDGGRSFPFRGLGIGVPRLESAYESFPAARFNLELKLDCSRLLERTLDIVAVGDRAGRTLLTTASDSGMAGLRRRLTERNIRAATGASIGEARRFVDRAGGPDLPREPMALQIPDVYEGRQIVTRALIERAHDHGVEVHVWTVNDAEEMTRLLALGVDGIVTDFPARLRQLLTEAGHLRLAPTTRHPLSRDFATRRAQRSTVRSVPRRRSR